MARLSKADIPVFAPAQLEAIAGVLGDTAQGLTGSEIGHHLAQAGIRDTDPSMTKRHRLYNALATRHNADKNGHATLQFIRYAMDPARYAGQRELFEARRQDLNVPLAFVGLQFGEDGRFHRVGHASTLSQAEERASRLRKKLTDRGVHPGVLAFCRPELVKDNYFHAVLEATKSVAEKIRRRTGLTTDGAAVVTGAMGGSDPILRINPLATDTERGEQRGFVNLLVGMFGVFRNPTAHAPRASWPMSEEDALDLLVLASYAHRRIDRAK